MKNIVFFGGSSQIALNLNKILKKKYTTRLVSRSKNNVKNCINIKNYSKTEIKKSFKRFLIVLFTEIILIGVINVVRIINRIEIPSTPIL